MSIEGIGAGKILTSATRGALDIASAALEEKHTGLTRLILAYSPKSVRNWVMNRRLSLAQLKAQESVFEGVARAVVEHYKKAADAALKAEAGSESALAYFTLEQAKRDLQFLATVREALTLVPESSDKGPSEIHEDGEEDVSWWDMFETLARRANEPWRRNMLARALAENDAYPGAVRLKALWEIGMLEKDDYGKLAIFCNASLHVDGLPVMFLSPEEQNGFVCTLEGDVREANLAHVVADLVDAGLIRRSLTHIVATEPVVLQHASCCHQLTYRPLGAEPGDPCAIQIDAYSPIDHALDICRLYEAKPDAASDANFESFRTTLTRESEDNPEFGSVTFIEV